MVGATGLEPVRPKSGAFKAPMPTNYIMPPNCHLHSNINAIIAKIILVDTNS